MPTHTHTHQAQTRAHPQWKPSVDGVRCAGDKVNQSRLCSVQGNHRSPRYYSHLLLCNKLQQLDVLQVVIAHCSSNAAKVVVYL